MAMTREETERAIADRLYGILAFSQGNREWHDTECWLAVAREAMRMMERVARKALSQPLEQNNWRNIDYGPIDLSPALEDEPCGQRSPVERRMTYCEECGKEVATTCNGCVETAALDAAEKVRDAIFADLTGLGIWIRDQDYSIPIVSKFLDRAQAIARMDRAKLAEIIAPKGERE